ncbi:MAG: 23S rRNA (uracil(1939)-C(5))-methyltransferase RlmD [Moorea sp. SIO3I7]|uniref:23S rRNA (uracil(1939)-C(5))-methyltransferase RlmD n=1 Tax=Moorena sp. SIO3I8 TaxID=2607833 RepID=UPI0013BF3BEB|nr:23S rRNA (uracil(1939)-C(5))-methyltransferase RlmD [Moorena sp. SIO3I8]NEN95273.1 23S rRNA (uracil(1939)-C(5))-methyltransferase RlmD [Moorena sp. SIO3I7]NEO04195.1 23S rRNA (uracil(1939)-C(5))-methyltransferase RlmD [Moorena sp. SIO3I8]
MPMMITNQPSPECWQQGQLIEVMITDLSDSGDGVGRLGNRVVFVPDTVTGDRALVRLMRVKPNYATGKLKQLLVESPNRVRPRCIVADKCGGCQWQHVSWDYQQLAKQNQVIQALKRIGGFSEPAVAPILTTDSPLGYRNKATYPLKRSATGSVQAGYYQKGSHQLINLNQCPVQDQRLNPLLGEIKQDIQQLGWSIYNESRHQGRLRHLSLQIGQRTGEMLLTLVTTDLNLKDLDVQGQTWLNRYPQLVGVCVNHNPHRSNVIFGSQTYCVAGQPYLRENFAGLELRLRPDTFFQVNTEAAEVLLNLIIKQLALKGDECVVDAYCGIGTFTLPLAQQVSQAIGIEVQAASVEQAEQNALNNRITNVKFQAGSVDQLLPHLTIAPDIVILDPPRKGCSPAVIDILRQVAPKRIVYISCKPATLARDLKLLCLNGYYQLTHIQPADFFPQTSHVECAAFLEH